MILISKDAIATLMDEGANFAMMANPIQGISFFGYSPRSPDQPNNEGHYEPLQLDHLFERPQVASINRGCTLYPNRCSLGSSHTMPNIFVRDLIAAGFKILSVWM
jgi:hypothetical protein